MRRSGEKRDGRQLGELLHHRSLCRSRLFMSAGLKSSRNSKSELELEFKFDRKLLNAKRETSRRPRQTRSRTMPYSAKVCSRVFSANNETRRGEGREREHFKLSANSNSSSLLQIYSRPRLGSGLYRVGHLLAELGWVDLDLECSTIMLGQ